MEVLISMGVLAVGLLGVAALIPAGRQKIAQSTRLESAAQVGRTAFREMEIRGFLNPGNASGTKANWLDHNNTAVWKGTSAPPFFSHDTNQVAVAIDPLGITAPAGSYQNKFPFNAMPFASLSTPRPLARIVPFQAQMTPTDLRLPTFDSIFRSSVDAITRPHTVSRDLPPTPYFFKDGSGNPTRRGSDGSYSWMVTVVSDPAIDVAGSNVVPSEVTVSVAVFSKRDLSTPGGGEFTASAIPYGFGGAPTDDFKLGNIQSQATPAQPVKGVRPGQWIMLAGTGFNGVVDVCYYRWYQVLSAGPLLAGSSQDVTLRGPRWVSGLPANDAWIFDNVVAVYEKTMKIEIE